MFCSLRTHLQHASHYRTAADRLWYWWNLVLRRFPTIRLPFRNQAVVITHKPSGWEFQIRLGSTDWYVANEIIELREYEFVRKWTPETFDTIVDLGANIGLSARFFAEMSPRAVIKVVEPAHENLEALTVNLAATQVIGRVFITHGFVGGQSGRASLDRSCGEWAIKMTPATNNQSVPVYSVSEILHQPPSFDIVDLLKCDIEGAEHEIFSSCAEWIRVVRFLVVETHSPYTSHQLCVDLARNGAAFELCQSSKTGYTTVSFLRNLTGIARP